MRHNVNARSLFIGVVVLVLFALCVIRLFSLQIVNGENFRKVSEQKLFMSMTVKAPRGNILDRYGKVLASNRMGYSVQVRQSDLSKEEFAIMLDNLVSLLEKQGVEITDQLPITMTEPYSFTYTGTPEEIAEKEVALKKKLNFDENLTAEEVVDKLVEVYGISTQEDQLTQRKLAGLIYDMKIRGFSMSNPYTIASDVSPNVVAVVKENNSELEGVEVVEEPIRIYPNGSMAAHILGNVGVIYQEEYEKLKDQDYSMDAIIGKEGVELAFEQYLRGKDGIRGFEQTISGLNDVVTSIPAEPGNNVILTIDSELQKVMESKLEETIQSIAASGGEGTGGDCNAGSAVCIDVRNGEILAMASYPAYDPTQYNKKYNELVQNPANPLWNRAISGAYEPGSTFKMLTAIAALEEGVTTPEEQILDEGVYKYYPDYQPQCMVWKYGRTHGLVNTSLALQESCNYYFFEVGRRLGIDKIEEYGKRFGLAQLTGIEIGGEVKGSLSSRIETEKNGGIWYPGNTLQAAIGQGNTLITPLQLANYVATIANGGTRYKPHLLKSVKAHDDGTVIAEGKAEVVETISMQPQNWAAVMEGMERVTEEGSASNVFKDFFVKVGGKTGTAELSKGSNNGVFVAFAPFDNPEIALAVVIEHGTAGNRAAPVAKAVFEQYFQTKEIVDRYETNILNQ